jgi:chaperonin cofactor prefoldin
MVNIFKSAIKQLNQKFNDLEIRYDHLETNYSKDQSKDKYKQNVKSNYSNN